MKQLFFLFLIFASSKTFATNIFLQYKDVIKEVEKFYLKDIPIIHNELGYLKELSLRVDIESSFHTVNICSLVDRMRLWQKHLPAVKVFYAIKTNHDEIISTVMTKLDAGFDCASLKEMQQALRVGALPEEIIFSHPRKPAEEIVFAEKHHIKKMVFDSIEELDKMMRFAPNGEFLLRIKTEDEHSDTPLSTKFGATMENAFGILDYAFKNKANVVGISFHVGSNNTDETAFTKAIDDAKKLFKYSEKHKRLKILDIGGGWPGNNDQRFILFANTVKSALAEFPSVEVIAEPGRFFATKTTAAAIKVVGTERLETKEGPHFSYFLSNGAYGLFSASIYFQYDAKKLANEDWNFHPLWDLKEDNLYPTTLWGPTCDSADMILKLRFPKLNLGEFIYSKNVGSYTYSGQTKFNQITPSRAYYTCKVDMASAL